MNFTFFAESVALGGGMAMDAVSVSLANGLSEPCMKRRKMLTMAGIFAVFQGVMPMLGWLIARTVLQYFTILEQAIPFIALGLLGFIGGKMIIEGLKHEEKDECGAKVCLRGLLLQGVATSIDAMSVGIVNAQYHLAEAFVSSAIIAAVTFVLCLLSVSVGKKFGTKLADKATLVGGIVLVIIGIEIFLTGIGVL